jgi:hypothetical protein
MLERERDGIANAETHAKVCRSEDPHPSNFTQRTLFSKVKTGSSATPARIRSEEAINP